MVWSNCFLLKTGLMSKALGQNQSACSRHGQTLTGTYSKVGPTVKPGLPGSLLALSRSAMSGVVLEYLFSSGERVLDDVCSILRRVQVEHRVQRALALIKLRQTAEAVRPIEVIVLTFLARHGQLITRHVERG